MADYIYVDNSNMFIEGQRVSAVSKGLAPDIFAAMNGGILDRSYTISFGKLHTLLAGDDLSGISRVALFGSRPPPDDSIWKQAKAAGFELHLEDRNAANKEKRIDTGVVTMMVRDAYKTADPKIDRFFLVAGDSDYVPTVSTLTADGYKVIVVFWNHAAKQLKDAATQFISLDNIAAQIQL